MLRHALVVIGVVACKGGGTPGDAAHVDVGSVDAPAVLDAPPDGVVAIDGALIDGALIDGALIDGALIDAAVDATVMTDAPVTACGDGVRVRGEECDDHNNNPNDGCDPTCRVEPPAGASAQVIAALHAIDALRAQADEAGVPMNTHVIQSSQAHATYYVTNAAAYAGSLSPHNEDANFPTGFTGVNFFDRMTAAGYTGSAFFETMAFSANPASAVAQWQNSVLHRIPLLHPNMRDFGYGLASASGRAADVCDFASGAPENALNVITWPPPNATGIPGSFNRLSEGPNPPAPPGGGNITGPIVSIWFANGTSATIASHVLTDVNGTVIAHTFVTPSDPSVGAFMSGSYALYGAGPAAAGSKFTVAITGTVSGQSFSRIWSFTTQ